MDAYFLSDPLSLLPPPGSSALKILIKVPDYSEPMLANVKLTVLEAVSFKFGLDGYQACLGALQRRPPSSGLPIQQRADVREDL